MWKQKNIRLTAFSDDIEKKFSNKLPDPLCMIKLPDEPEYGWYRIPSYCGLHKNKRESETSLTLHLSLEREMGIEPTTLSLGS